MEKSNIINLFEDEFGFVKDKFNIIEYSLNEETLHQNNGAAMPGVYVFLKNEQVIRIGRSLSNSRKRALQHLEDNTAGWMKQLENDSETILLLFNIKHSEDLHWVAALEIFLEMKLKPEIPSRLG